MASAFWPCLGKVPGEAIELRSVLCVLSTQQLLNLAFTSLPLLPSLALRPYSRLSPTIVHIVGTPHPGQV